MIVVYFILISAIYSSFSCTVLKTRTFNEIILSCMYTEYTYLPTILHHPKDLGIDTSIVETMAL